MIAAVRRRPLPALATFGAAVLLGFLLALVATDTGSGRVATVVELPPATVAAPQAGGSQGATGATPAPAPQRSQVAGEQARLREALMRGVVAAERFGGTAEAAVWLDGWSAPVIAGDKDRAMRMWSMSKVVTAVAVFERVAGRQPSPELEEALVAALVRSENCPQRRVIVGLQQLAGGVEQARAAFDDVLARAGARATIAGAPQAPEEYCQPYLTTHDATVPGHALDPAYQYGTATWTVGDAVAFAHALGTGEYGEPGRRVLELLRRPKQPSTEEGAQLSTSTGWGVGQVFGAAAYKAGWGGAQRGDFLVGQIAVVSSGGRTAAIAAMFHPLRQPAADDPGQAHAAEALEALLRPLALQLGS